MFRIAMTRKDHHFVSPLLKSHSRINDQSFRTTDAEVRVQEDDRLVGWRSWSVPCLLLDSFRRRSRFVGRHGIREVGKRQLPVSWRAKLRRQADFEGELAARKQACDALGRCWLYPR
jgi:hypothetical protein